MPPQTGHFNGRKYELEQFGHILSYKGFNKKSRVILIQGLNGLGKTALAQHCIEMAQKARWQTVSVNWAEKTPHTPSELLSILTRAIWSVVGEQQIKFVDEVVTRIETLKEAVQQYKKDHPEIWQKIMAAEKPSAQVNGQIDPYSDRFHADTTDLNHRTQQNLISYMLQHNIFPKRLDELALRDPSRKLAQAISESMVNCAGRRGLVVWFDSCEMLSPELGVFLRDTIILPALDKNEKLHFLLSSATDLYHERTVKDAFGIDHRIKGYGDRMYSPPPVVWHPQRMVDPEVNELLNETELDNNESSVEMVKSISCGIPFLTELAIDAMKHQGSTHIAAIIKDGETCEGNLPDYIAGVIKRFIENYPDPTEVLLLYALALLLKPNDAALAAVCSLSENDPPGPIIRKLSEAYTFISSEGYLHDVMRVNLRNYLRSTIPDYAHFLGQNAVIHYQTLSKNYTYEHIEARINDQRWQEIQRNLLNALCWTDERRTLRSLIALVLEGESLNSSFGHSLLSLTSEFRNADSFWSQEACDLWDTLAQLLSTRHEIRLKAHEKLAEQSTILKIDTERTALLNILLAQLYIAEGQADRAISLCDTVTEDTLHDPSISHLLAAAYNDAGIALGFEAGEAVASDRALHAFQRASELESQVAESQYGLGAVLAAFNKLEEATETFSKVLTLNPKHANSTFQRGLALFNLGNYIAARDDFTQSLNLSPRHAQASYYRGMTDLHLGEQRRALEDFTKAISFDPGHPAVYSMRGVTYTALGQYTSALEDFTRALQLDQSIADVYLRRGETYLKLKQHEDAILDFNHAIALNPEMLEAYEIRGMTYAGLDRHEQALTDYHQALSLDPESAEIHAKSGDSYAALHQHENALEAYTEALRLNPVMPDIYTKRGQILLHIGEESNALVDFNKALEINPRQAVALVGRGHIHLNQEAYEAAIADYNTAYETDPSHIDFKAQRGRAYLHTQQYNKAIVDLNQAIAANPDNALLFYYRGLANYRLERYHEAIDDFIEALDRNPQLVDVYVHRANTYAQLDNPEQALIDYGQAIAVDPQNAFAYYSRGCIYIDFGQFEEALDDLSQALSFDLEMADAYNKRGLCYANLDQIEKALEDYAQAIKLDPQNAAAYNNRGNTFAKIEEPEKALLDYTQAITYNPQLAEAYYNRGNILSDLGQYDKAIADFSEALALNPDMIQAYYNRGNGYAKIGQLQKALADLDRVLAQNPEDTAALNNRGNIYADLGEHEHALADYATALEMNPDLAEVYTNRGLTYAEMGQYDEALADYAKALAYNSRDATAIYYSACAFALSGDESQACAWLEQAILMDGSYRHLAQEDPDFDDMRNIECFQSLIGSE